MLNGFGGSGAGMLWKLEAAADICNERMADAVVLMDLYHHVQRAAWVVAVRADRTRHAVGEREERAFVQRRRVIDASELHRGSLLLPARSGGKVGTKASKRESWGALVPTVLRMSVSFHARSCYDFKDDHVAERACDLEACPA
jgi:hypothetical protein